MKCWFVIFILSCCTVGEGATAKSPSAKPSPVPSFAPSPFPTAIPTTGPTKMPSPSPSVPPTANPTTPTKKPTAMPTTPTKKPSAMPSTKPTLIPTASPSCRPTLFPTFAPSTLPTWAPTNHGPTFAPTPFLTQRYESIDNGTFNVYGTLWARSHASWINVNADSIGCPPSLANVIFPVCQGAFVVHGQNPNEQSSIQCSSAQCSSNPCLVTPDDTIDYLPILPNTTFDADEICKPPSSDAAVVAPDYGLDQGIPPLFVPITPIRLQLKGTIKRSVDSQCIAVPGAVITFWQVNPWKLRPYSSTSERLDGRDTSPAGLGLKSKMASNGYIGVRTFTHPSPTTPPPPSLREISCAATLHSGPDGSYAIHTVMPPSYGPPRHLMLSVTAPGFQTLFTRVYFDQDWRLRQLAQTKVDAYHANKKFGKVGKNMTTFAVADDDDFVSPRVAAQQANDTSKSRAYFSGPISRDPRVAVLDFVTTGSSKGRVRGYFEATFDVVLSQLRPLAAADTMPPLDLSGLWAERNGGLVNVENVGNVFVATEYPHTRTWGTVVGTLDGDTVRGVDFSKSIMANPASRNVNVGNKDVQINADGSINIVSTPAWNATHMLNAAQSRDLAVPPMPDSIWNSGFSNGLVLPVDPFSTAPLTPFTSGEMTIRWTGGNTDNEWYKQPPSQQGYRYLKLQITRETGGYSNGKMVINEIEFYCGILSQQIVPDPTMKMRTPRFPIPQMVTCSTYQDSNTHCFKAFDGDASSNSAWMTLPVGSKQDTLAQPQFVLFDLGPRHFARPTSMKIVCGAGDLTPLGCPKTFKLLGSYDNMLFDVITSVDLYDYDNDYADGGKTFNFFWEAPTGRPNGHRCGSCATGPTFKCAVQAFDWTCASTYCDINGFCGEPPKCPAGQYMYTGYMRDGEINTECRQCAPGRYGNVSGATDGFCTGLCSPGYFCTAGSTSPTQQKCGGVDRYCPQGSAFPQPVPVGKYSVDEGGGETTDPLTRSATALCPAGHYCRGGVHIQCPIGSYGAILGLQTNQCSGECLPGEYCNIGSVQPSICEKGYYCPDGRLRIVCPAGTYGAIKGLNNRACSGLCRPGYYCLKGSVSPVSAICAAGLYGSVAGLQSPECSGSCTAGYYCPAGSTVPTAVECGGANVYCPVGSPLPVPVSVGHYTIGGWETRRTAQAICEPGFYCYEGLKYPCPAGTFGDVFGLPLDPSLATFTCSGWCSPGYYCPLNSTSPLQVACPAGRFGYTYGLANSSCSAACPVGHFCPAASTQPTICKPGIFGNETELKTSACSSTCWEIGCDDNLCQEGYYCPSGSVVATQVRCGSPALYCPKGSALPTPVLPGYYSVGAWNVVGSRTADSTALIRVSQLICEIGNFCIGGIRSLCPPGTYGSATGLSSSACSGPCPPGYYCPPGSYNATMYRCPSGRYGEGCRDYHHEIE